MLPTESRLPRLSSLRRRFENLGWLVNVESVSQPFPFAKIPATSSWRLPAFDAQLAQESLISKHILFLSLFSSDINTNSRCLSRAAMMGEVLTYVRERLDGAVRESASRLWKAYRGQA